MKKYKYLLAGVMALAAVAIGHVQAYGVAAIPTPVTYTNPDGTTVTIRLYGDERFNYATTLDGYLLMPDSKGFYCYAQSDKSGSAIVASDIRATDAEARSSADEAFLSTLDKSGLVSSYCAGAQKAIDTFNDGLAEESAGRSRAGTNEKRSNFPVFGSTKALVILMQYQDVKMTYGTNAQFNKMLNQRGYSDYGATGSVYDYFEAVSDGQFTPQFDVVGPVTLSKTREEYGINGSNYATIATKQIREALDLLEAEGMDFSPYDTDGDGSVDNIFVFYAGQGQADGGGAQTIWPHAWNLSATSSHVRYDGVLINRYACSYEIQTSGGKTFTGIGTFCHEFSHVMGLADHYDTAGNGSFVPGNYDIMSAGNYNNNQRTPPLYSGYERYVMGWVVPTDLTGAENVVLPPASDGGYSDVRTIRTSTSNEYYVLESRSKTGWDTYLPHHGMLVWHIDYNSSIWSSNRVNSTPDHQRVDLVEADNILSSGSLTGDPFPGNKNITSFTDDTTPSMISWTGKRLNAPITDIKEDKDGVITFRFKGGIEVKSDLEFLAPTDVTHNSATISWKPIKDVEEYEVELSLENGMVLSPKATVTETSITFSKLMPDTKYVCTVGYIKDFFMCYKSIEFTSGKAPFNMRRAVGNEVISMTDRSAVLSWQSVEDAESYSVSVNRTESTGPGTTSVNFDNNEIPDGWDTTLDMDENITSSGYYGSAAPAAQFTRDEQYIESPEFYGNITQVSFVTRRVGTGSSSFTLQARTSRSAPWITVWEGAPSASKSRKSVTSAQLGTGIHQIRLIFHKDESNATVDDLTVTSDDNLIMTPIDGMTDMSAGDKLSMRVDGLTPGTVYSYSVTAHKGSEASVPSLPVVFTTLDAPTLTKLRPVANEAEDITDEAMTASWSELMLAETYTVNLYEHSFGSATDLVDFTDNALPAGWKTNLDMSAMITSASYYGTASPAAQATISNQYLLSPLYSGNVSDMTFVVRRIGTGDASVTIEGRGSETDSWTTIASITVSTSKSRKHLYSSDLGDNIHQIRITFILDNSKMSIDDITLAIDNNEEIIPVESHTSLPAGSELSLRVKGLKPLTTYSYTVTAHNPTESSLESEPVKFTTLDPTSGIEDLEAADAEFGYSVEGRTLTLSLAEDAVVEVVDLSGRTLLAPSAVKVGTTSMELPTSGLYIVIVNGKAIRVASK